MRIKPRTAEHFYKSGNNFVSICVDCSRVGRSSEIAKDIKKGFIRCNHCQTLKQANTHNYYPSDRLKSGFKGTCKVCSREAESPKHYQKLLLFEHGFKKCSKSLEVKKTTKFYVDPRYLGGISNKCIFCEATRQREYRKSTYEIRLEKERSYRKRNRHIYNANKKDRQRALPKWLSEEQKKEMHKIYQDANLLSTLTGIEHEVDHIVPIKHPSACGLHVPWNLEVVPLQTNRRKGNRADLTLLEFSSPNGTSR